MTYKDTLIFIGNSITISHDSKALKKVTSYLKTNTIDWDAVVQLSTKHYVFTTLYCSFLKAELLSFLPEDLVSYMKYLTDLNRARNQKIIQQSREIRSLLLQHHIHPIFLKGTGNLLEELYDDIGERMVGDIDFLVAPNCFDKTIEILKESGYYKVFDHHQIPDKHYPRMVKEDCIAAIEIHKELVKSPYESTLNYDIIKGDTIEINGVSLLSHEHQLCLSIIAKQINDDGQYYNTIALRNAYDVWYLSQKADALRSVEKLRPIFHPLNNFLGLCHCVLSDEITHKKTEASEKYLSTFNMLLENEQYRYRHQKRWERKLYWRTRFGIFLKVFFQKDYRIWFWKTITSRGWLISKLNQFFDVFKIQSSVISRTHQQ